MTKMQTCRACGIEIQWGRTEKGHAMPIDKMADDDGNVVFMPDGTVHVLNREEKREPVTRPRFKAHFATCTKRGKR